MKSDLNRRTDRPTEGSTDIHIASQRGRRNSLTFPPDHPTFTMALFGTRSPESAIAIMTRASIFLLMSHDGVSGVRRRRENKAELLTTQLPLYLSSHQFFSQIIKRKLSFPLSSDGAERSWLASVLTSLYQYGRRRAQRVGFSASSD